MSGGTRLGQGVSGERWRFAHAPKASAMGEDARRPLLAISEIRWWCSPSRFVDLDCGHRDGSSLAQLRIRRTSQ